MAWAIYNPETGFAEILLSSRREARQNSFPEEKEKVLEVALLPEKSKADYLPVIGWAVKDTLLPGRHEARSLAKETGNIVRKAVLA